MSDLEFPLCPKCKLNASNVFHESLKDNFVGKSLFKKTSLSKLASIIILYFLIKYTFLLQQIQ